MLVPAFCMFSHLIFTVTWQGKYYSHFKDKKTESQRGKVICPRSGHTTSKWLSSIQFQLYVHHSRGLSVLICKVRDRFLWTLSALRLQEMCLGASCFQCACSLGSRPGSVLRPPPDGFSCRRCLQARSPGLL